MGNRLSLGHADRSRFRQTPSIDPGRTPPCRGEHGAVRGKPDRRGQCHRRRSPLCRGMGPRLRRRGRSSLDRRAVRRRPGEQTALGRRQETTMRRLIVRRCPDQLKLPSALLTREVAGQLIGRKTGIRRSLTAIGTYLSAWAMAPRKPIRRTTERNEAVIATLVRWVRSALRGRSDPLPHRMVRPIRCSTLARYPLRLRLYPFSVWVSCPPFSLLYGNSGLRCSLSQSWYSFSTSTPVDFGSLEPSRSIAGSCWLPGKMVKRRRYDLSGQRCARSSPYGASSSPSNAPVVSGLLQDAESPARCDR